MTDDFYDEDDVKSDDDCFLILMRTIYWADAGERAVYVVLRILMWL